MKALGFLLVAAYCLFFQNISRAQEKDPEVYDEWRLSKEKDGIQIYTRWIEAEEGRKARQIHTVMTVNASLSASVYAIKNDQQVKKWLNRAKEYYHFDETDDYHWFAYTEFNIPWPLENQDLITRDFLSQDANTGKVLITLEGEPKKLPEKNNVQRIPQFEGSWELTPKSGNKVKIDYFIFTRTKPFLPRWIIDPIVTYGLWSTFDKLRVQISENESRKVKLPYIL